MYDEQSHQTTTYLATSVHADHSNDCCSDDDTDFEASHCDYVSSFLRLFLLMLR